MTKRFASFRSPGAMTGMWSSLRHVEMAAKKLDVGWLAALVAGQRQERRVERGVRFWPERRIVDGRALKLLEPIVGPGIQLDHLEPLFDKRDKRQEQRSVESIFVKVVGSDIRGRDHYNARGEESGKQPAQDHRVRNVAHRKLVEAKERRFPRQITRNWRDRVFAVDFAALARLAPKIEARMHIGHEGVKMRPALDGPFDGVEEHIHQHRLAAPDWPVDVKAARRLSGLHAKQP
jgi:hypothetical protein